MCLKLRATALGVAAALTALTIGLSGTAMADTTYQVTGTGDAGANLHNEPSPFTPSLGVLADGTDITIVCQTQSVSVTDPVTGVSSDIWDDLGPSHAGNDIYISDLYVNTPVAGGFSPGIPQCSS
jgi:hypothetical protein